MYLASAIEKRFKSHLRFLCDFVLSFERGRHKKKKKPEDTLNGTVNCLETTVLFTDSISSYGLRGRFRSSTLHEIEIVNSKKLKDLLHHDFRRNIFDVADDIRRILSLKISRTIRYLYLANLEFFEKIRKLFCFMQIDSARTWFDLYICHVSLEAMEPRFHGQFKLYQKFIHNVIQLMIRIVNNK